MKRSILSMAMIAACLLGGSVHVTACSNGSGGEQPSSTGTVRFPLISQVNGNTYRLLANINIYGPTYTYLSTGDDPEATVLTTTLQTGYYTAYLNYWSLERQDSNGAFHPVSASLISDYYVDFSIYNQSSTTISFQFETDGVVVPFGEGQLNVKFGVTELTPACTPLGSDCPSGSWCPPPGLTGEPLNCVPAGSVELGNDCERPTDCVANATCIDLGDGPECASLCLPSETGSPCAVGGTCTAASADHGVCVPEGGSLPGGGGDAGVGGSGGSGGFGGFPTGGTTWVPSVGGKPAY